MSNRKEQGLSYTDGRSIDAHSSKDRIIVGDGGRGWREAAEKRKKQLSNNEPKWKTDRGGSGRDNRRASRWETDTSSSSSSSQQSNKKHKSNDYDVREKKMKVENDKIKELMKSSPSVKTTTASTTAIDTNKLAAMAMKAKLKGNKELHASILKQIEEAKNNNATRTTTTTQRKVIMKMLPSISGQRLMAQASMRSNNKDNNNNQQNNNLYKDGQRESYFKDDHNTATVNEMLKEERINNNRSYDENYARSIIRNTRYKQHNTDAEYDALDDGLADEYEDYRHQGKTQEISDKRIKSSLAYDMRQQDKEIKLCSYCSPYSRLVVSKLENMYLCLPRVKRVQQMHSVLIPVVHTTSVVNMDVQTYEEYRFYQKCLCFMYKELNKGVLFIEQVNDTSKGHTVIQCIPIDTSLIKDVSAYFIESLKSADTEWSDNECIIRTNVKEGRSIQKMIPKNFNYFHVEIGMEEGIAHIIEDRKKFPFDFGIRVICGLLNELKSNNDDDNDDIEVEFILRQRAESVDNEEKRMKEFKKIWQLYDQ